MTAMPVQAAALDHSNTDPYAAAVNEINDKYDTELGVGEFDHSKVALDEFYQIIEEEAQRQAALEAAINSRHFNTESLNAGDGIMAIAASKSATKDAWGYETQYSITANYTVNGNKITGFQNAYVSSKNLLFFQFVANSGYPVTSIIDSGRTLTVTFVGTHFLVGTSEIIPILNTKLYAEFTANS